MGLCSLGWEDGLSFCAILELQQCEELANPKQGWEESKWPFSLVIASCVHHKRY